MHRQMMVALSLALAVSTVPAWGQQIGPRRCQLGDTVTMIDGGDVLCGAAAQGQTPEIVQFPDGAHLRIYKGDDGLRVDDRNHRLESVTIIGADDKPRRTYTLDEIERLRVVVTVLLSPGSRLVNGAMFCDQSACRVPSDIEIATTLNTYIAAGISPAELERKAEGK